MDVIIIWFGCYYKVITFGDTNENISLFLFIFLFLVILFYHVSDMLSKPVLLVLGEALMSLFKKKSVNQISEYKKTVHCSLNII